VNNKIFPENRKAGAVPGFDVGLLNFCVLPIPDNQLEGWVFWDLAWMVQWKGMK